MSKSITARRLSAAALTAVLTVPASAAEHRPHRPDVQIADVQYDSPGRDDRSHRSLNREWVEITNHSRRAVNLDGWTLEDEEGHTYTFDHYRLGGRATVRIHTGVGRDTRTDLFRERRHYVWDNRSDTATDPAQRPRPLRRRGLLGPPPQRPPLTSPARQGDTGFTPGSTAPARCAAPIWKGAAPSA